MSKSISQTGLIAAAGFLLFAAEAFGTTRTVIQNGDSGTGSLRQAIADSVNGDTINFSVNGTITLTSPILLNKNLTITGPGARKLTIAAGANVATTFPVASGTSTISGLTIGPGGNGFNLQNPGATLTLNDCAVVDNTFGGGIFTNIGTTLTVNGCTFSGNRDDSVNVPVKYGSGIINEGTATLTNCTFTNNSPNGIFNAFGTMTIKSCTITGNTGSVTGGISNVATLNITNTVVSGNNGSTSPDVSGSFTSNGYNVIAKKDGSTGFTNGVNHDVAGTIASPRDALLAPLLNNGGPTDTCAIFASSSSAFNAGNPATAPARDQRGFLRPDTPDAGACEFLGTQSVTLANISSRGLVQTGNDVLIGGFIITVNQKKVLLRAIGPSLNLRGQLSDPTLELYLGNQLLTTNDNWGNAANHVEIMNTGAAPTNAAESAILSTLSPGSYTFIMRGAGGGTGIGVVEAYDLERAVGSRLANISTRAAVQTGDNILIGGFIVLGPDSMPVIVRGIGPSLNVPGQMLDPTLELHDGNGGTLATNDNWKSTQQTEINATTIPPTNDAESAIVMTLAPGNYTAILRGAGNATGVAVVEVYGLL
jgi:hypothetical protein